MEVCKIILLDKRKSQEKCLDRSYYWRQYMKHWAKRKIICKQSKNAPNLTSSWLPLYVHPKNSNHLAFDHSRLGLENKFSESRIFLTNLGVCKPTLYSGAPARAKRAWDRAPYSWNMVNLFSFGCHVIDGAYVRTYVRVYRLYGWGRGDYQKEGRGVSGVSGQVHIFNIGL